MQQPRTFIDVQVLRSLTHEEKMYTSYHHSSYQPPLRRELKKWLRSINGTHIVTLAFHDRYLLDRATRCVDLWFKRLAKRLFGRRWNAIPAAESLQVMLLPEGAIGHLHFHGQLYIAPRHQVRMLKLAPKFWKAIVPTGHVHLDPVREHDLDIWLNYITKSEVGWNSHRVLPGMLDLH